MAYITKNLYLDLKTQFQIYIVHAIYIYRHQKSSLMGIMGIMGISGTLVKLTLL